MLRRSSCLAAILAFCVIVPCVVSDCRADCWGGDFGYGPYGYFTSRIGSSPYGLGRIPTPPYFALHPPVYYSYPVPRPYGFSPFPYPGTMVTPAVFDEIVQPAVIDNPYIEGTQAPAAEGTIEGTGTSAPKEKIQSDDGLAASGPQVIHNPYADRGDSASQWVKYAR